MRSARMLMATAAASAVLTLGAPGAYASGGWDTKDSSYGKEHDQGQDTEKEHGKEHGKDGHYAPRGGMHTGGGALTTVTDDGWSKPDPETTKGGEQGTASDAARQDVGSGTAKQDTDSWNGQQDTDSGTAKQDEGSWNGQQDTDSGTAKQDQESWNGQQDTDSGTAKQNEGSWNGKQDEGSWSGEQEKPSGGVHTGGGGLAVPAVTAGGLAVLAVAATGLYAARRKKTAGSVA